MINSIIPLPEFAAPGTTICGMCKGGIFNCDDFADIPEMHIIGRNITIYPDQINKYKLRLVDYGTHKTYTIVFATFEKLDIYNLRNNPLVEIFPLYLREYCEPGVISPLKSNLMVFIPGINRLFQKMNIPPVLNLAQTLYHVMEHLGAFSDNSHIPKYLLERMYSKEYGTLACAPETVVNSIFMGGIEAQQELDATTDYCCILDGYVAREANFVMHQVFLRDILPLMDPNHAMDPTSLSVLNAMQDWGLYYTWIHERDDNCPRYQTHTATEEMPYLLFATGMFNTVDYKIECAPPSVTNISGNLFDANLIRSTNKLPDYNILTKFRQAVRCQVHRDYEYDLSSTVTAIGSYLEDLYIYDKSNDLIAYFDLVYWILAAGAGLYNQNAVIV